MTIYTNEYVHSCNTKHNDEIDVLMDSVNNLLNQNKILSHLEQYNKKLNIIKFTGINKHIPEYLKLKYKNISLGKNGKKSILILVKNIFDKVSLSNTKECIIEFNKLNIDNYVEETTNLDLYNDISIYIYETIIDLIYLINPNIEIMKDIKVNNKKIFTNVCELLINYSINYQIFDDLNKTKRWRMNNSTMIAEFFNNGFITYENICSVIKNYKEKMDDSFNIELICNILSKLKEIDELFMNEIEDYLSELLKNVDIDFRIKTLIMLTFESDIFTN